MARKTRGPLSIITSSTEVMRPRPAVAMRPSAQPIPHLVEGDGDGRIDVELVELHHSGQDGHDRDVEDGAEHQRGDDAEWARPAGGFLASSVWVETESKPM